MQDSLGDRMKNYENRYRHLLPRRGYTLLRLDGCAFHTYTKGFDRPFDLGFMAAMDHTAKYLCEKIQGANLAYVQSDEITLILTDFKKITSDAWFDGNINKITSVAASMATFAFFSYRLKNANDSRPALFDCRSWFLSDPFEVENSLIWRQIDATRNSIISVTQSLHSHKEMHGKKTSEQQDMIWKKGQNWNDYPVGQKRGRIIKKIQFEKEV